MKKISQITMHYYPMTGGQDVYVQQLIDLFKQQSIVYSVLQPAKTKLVAPKYIHYLPRIPLLGKLITGFDWLWFNRVLKFKKQFLKIQDILISHYPFHLPSLIFHQKIIIISHGVDWPKHPGFWFDKIKFKLAKKSIELTKKNVIVVANDTNFLREMGYKIKPSTNFYKEVAKNIWFIPNAIDFKKFKRSFQKREKIILVPRNIRRSRGIDLAIKSFFELVKNPFFTDFKLVIVGGPLRGKFYKECLKLSKNDKRISFLGNLDQKEIKKLYSIASVTLIPTRNYEGTSLSALESIASGTPVVSTKIGGLQDLPTHKTSLKIDEMSNALERVVNKQKFYADKQYLQASKTFNQDRWKKAWLKVIK